MESRKYKKQFFFFFLPFETTWMEPKAISLSEINGTEKDK